MSPRIALRTAVTGLAGAGLLAGLVTLAGCGKLGTAAGPNPAEHSGHSLARNPASRTLCPASGSSAVATVTKVRITHVPSIAQLGGKTAARLPAITVRGAGAVTLAAAVCALPPLARGEYMCPLDTGGEYLLAFAAAGRNLPVVTVHPRGCQSVLGSGVIRSAQRAAEFWTILERVSGIDGIAHPILSWSP